MSKDKGAGIVLEAVEPPPTPKLGYDPIKLANWLSSLDSQFEAMGVSPAEAKDAAAIYRKNIAFLTGEQFNQIAKNPSMRGAMKVVQTRDALISSLLSDVQLPIAQNFADSLDILAGRARGALDQLGSTPVHEIDRELAEGARMTALGTAYNNDNTRSVSGKYTARQRLIMTTQDIRTLYPSYGESDRMRSLTQYIGTKSRSIDDATASNILKDLKGALQKKENPQTALIESMASHSPAFAERIAGDKSAAAKYIHDFVTSKTADLEKLRTDHGAGSREYVQAYRNMLREGMTEFHKKFPFVNTQGMGLPSKVGWMLRQKGYDPELLREAGFHNPELAKPGAISSALNTIGKKGVLWDDNGKFLKRRLFGVSALAFLAAGLYRSWNRANSGEDPQWITSPLRGIGEGAWKIGEAVSRLEHGGMQQPQAPMAQPQPQGPASPQEEMMELFRNNPAAGQLMLQQQKMAGDNAMELGKIQGAAQGKIMSDALKTLNFDRLSNTEIPIAVNQIMEKVQARRDAADGNMTYEKQMDDFRRAMGGS